LYEHKYLLEKPMLVQDILTHDPFITAVKQTIQQDCSDFIRESDGLPLFKTLPDTYNDFHRVKVRLQKRRDQVSDVFEQAFGEQFTNFRQRSVFANSTLLESADPTTSFYIFPVNGYRYMYCKEVENSNSEYKTVIDTVMQGMGNVNEATQIVTDLVKYTYVSSHLSEGIASGAEVILYSIPFYYAVRTTVSPTYTNLITR
jgi:hypothetical protein